MPEKRNTVPQELLEKAFRLGREYEKSCTGCGQTTIAAVLETLGIESDDAFRAASGLADGIGLTGDGSCGALTGGCMAMGLVHGRTREQFSDPFAAMKSYDLARELHQDFVTRYGSSRCREIQERLMGRFFDLRDEKDMVAAMEQGMLEHCSTVVGNCARKAVELILRADAAAGSAPQTPGSS